MCDWCLEFSILEFLVIVIILCNANRCIRQFCLSYFWTQKKTGENHSKHNDSEYWIEPVDSFVHKNVSVLGKKWNVCIFLNTPLLWNVRNITFKLYIWIVFTFYLCTRNRDCIHAVSKNSHVENGKGKKHVMCGRQDYGISMYTTDRDSILASI